MSGLNYEADGYARVPLTVDDAELLADCLELMWNSQRSRRAQVEALARSTGIAPAWWQDPAEVSP
jgi:hypothetical protein